MSDENAVRLEKIASHHSAALLSFERENAEDFAQYVPPRPPEMLTTDGMTAAIQSLVDEMERGEGMYFVGLEGDDVIGRLNFTFDGEVSEVGYRVGKKAAGRGLAGWMLNEGATVVRAKGVISRLTGHSLSTNPASIRVMERAGFELVRVDEGGGAKVGMSGDIHFFERQL